MKEILLYSPIYSFTAVDYISQLETFKNSAIAVRMNCPGGDVYAGYGMIAKFAEHAKEKKIKVDGQAKSGGCYMCFYAEDVECLDVSDFMVHRAALPSWVENDPKVFTDDLKAMLTKINTSLRSGIESKVSAETFKKVTGTSLDDMFSLDSRIDVNFNAEQAKKMGLVKKVIPLTPEKKNEIKALAATNGVAAFAQEPVLPEAKTDNNSTKMDIKTLADFKAQYPGLFAEAVAQGATDERDRIESWLAYSEIDPKAVAEGIASGKEVSRKQQNDFFVKGMAKNKVEALKDDNAPDAKTPEVNGKTPTAEEANRAEFLKNCKANLNLK